MLYEYDVPSSLRLRRRRNFIRDECTIKDRVASYARLDQTKFVEVEFVRRKSLENARRVATLYLPIPPPQIPSRHGDDTADPALDKMIPTINPYSANASAKIKIRIIPVNSFGCCAFALTPASPTMPMAIPAASPESPHESPLPRCAYPWNSVYVPPGLVFVLMITAMMRP
eukprot:30017-Pelagococcus_subviridis.AAC.2